MTTASMTTTVFQKVANRELTPEAGAQLLMDDEEKQKQIQKPNWMPRWLFVAGLFLLSILVAPLLSSKNNQS